MFGTKITIESQMFDCKHILEILPPQIRARQGHRQQSNLINPKIFGTKIRIESQMFDYKHILEIPPQSGPDRATDNSPT